MRRMRIVAFGMSALLSLGPLAQPAHGQAEPPPAQRAAPASDAGWNALTAATRQKIEVLTIDGSWHKSRLRLVTSDAIVLDSDQPPVRREQVWQVWAGGKPSWGWRGFWIGLAAGLAVGIAAYSDQGDCADPASVCAREGEFGAGAIVAGSLVFGAGGAIIGRLIGGPSHEPALAYAGPTVFNPPPRAADKRP